MANNDSILKGIFKYSISNWVGVIVGFLSVIISTRIITPDVYGIVMLFLSATQVTMYVMTLGMDGACIRFYNEPPCNNSQNQLLYKNIIISSVICILTGVISVIFISGSVAEFLFGFSSRLLIGLLFLYTLCQIVLRYLNISYRMSFNAKMYNIQNILINSSSRVLIIAAAFIRNNSLFIISVLTIGIFVVLLVYLIKQRKQITPLGNDGIISLSLNMKGYGEYMRYAVFNAPTYIVTYFNTFACQQIIRQQLSAYALGIFSSTGAFTAVLSVVKGGFSTFWSAYVYKEYEGKQETIIKMHDFLLVFTIMATSVLMSCRDIVYLAIGSSYHDSKSFFSLLLVMPILTFIEETTDKGVALSKKSYIWTITHMLSVVTNIGLCFLFVKGFDLMGAAWANAIAAVLLYVLNTVYGQKYYRSISDYTKSIKGTLILLLLLIVPALTLNIWIIILCCVSLDIIAYFVYAEEVKYMLKRSLSFVRNIIR
jgi:O-antigen/teichoic acid export membrane protein